MQAQKQIKINFEISYNTIVAKSDFVTSILDIVQ